MSSPVRLLAWAGPEQGDELADCPRYSLDDLLQKILQPLQLGAQGTRPVTICANNVLSSGWWWLVAGQVAWLTPET